MKLNASDVQIISLGAHVLGGGGGGPADRGLRSAKEAFELGCVELVDLTNLPDEALVVTVSGVGAPSRTASSKSPLMPMDRQSNSASLSPISRLMSTKS